MGVRRALRVSDGPGLRAIAEEDVNIVVWERAMDPAVEQGFAELALSLEAGRTAGGEVWPDRPETLQAVFDDLCSAAPLSGELEVEAPPARHAGPRSSGQPGLDATPTIQGIQGIQGDRAHITPATTPPTAQPAMRQAAMQRWLAYWADDIADLVARYAELVEQPHAWVQLGVVAHDMCRKLHADNLPLRMLCTYAGPGTDWVADADARREHLERCDVGVEEANASVMRHPKALQRAGCFDVVLLKGGRWWGNSGHGAIHRSPPVEADGARRLLLKVDARRIGA